MSAAQPLTALFVSHLDPALRERLNDPGNLERQLGALVAAASAAWPELDVPAQVFLPFVAERLGAVMLDAVEAGDLFLACACLRGDAKAIATLEAAYFPELDRALARMKLKSRADDVKQLVRERLLVARPGKRPKLAEYTGRGKLRAWLKIVGVREALDLIDRERREVPVEAAALEDFATAHGDPELQHVKRAHRAAFKAAFEHAFESLPARARNLLRQQVLDGLTAEQIGTIYKVHLATAARWLVQARRDLIRRTRAELRVRLGISLAECDSLLRMADSQLDVSISRVLRRHSE